MDGEVPSSERALMGLPHAWLCWTVTEYARFSKPMPDGRTLVPGGRPPDPAYLILIAALGIVPGRLSHPNVQDS